MGVSVEQTKAETARAHAHARFCVKRDGKVVGRNLTVEAADKLAFDLASEVTL